MKVLFDNDDMYKTILNSSEYIQGHSNLLFTMGISETKTSFGLLLLYFRHFLNLKTFSRHIFNEK